MGQGSKIASQAGSCKVSHMILNFGSVKAIGLNGSIVGQFLSDWQKFRTAGMIEPQERNHHH